MSVVSYKCPNCGGPLTFNADKQLFSCDYCCSEFSEQQVIEYNKSLDEQLDNKENQEKVEQKDDQKNVEDKECDEFAANAVYYTCPSCGAEIITDSTTAATECFFCHNAVVLGGRLSGDLKPDKVVPFAISKEKAIETFKKNFSKKKFLPNQFFNKKQIEKLTGIYFPYWYIDSKENVNMTAKTKKVRAWVVGDNQYTETSTYSCQRNADIDINDMFRAALSKQDQLLLKYVHPYDMTAAKDFSMAYLSGYQADKRDIEVKALKESVRAELSNHEQTLLKGTITQGTVTAIENFTTKNLVQDWSYSLLPVWILTYKHKDKTYIYGMNAQTGKIYGELPISFGKLMALVGIVIAILLIIFTIGGFLL